MANMSEIRTRIKGIQDIMKITNAMYLISSSKLKKARKTLLATEPYFEKLQETIHDILFYAHTILRAGIDYKAWYKVGKSKELGLDGLSKVLWGSVHDYKATRVPPEEGYFKLTKVNPIENWAIWKIYGERIDIGIGKRRSSDRLFVNPRSIN